MYQVDRSSRAHPATVTATVMSSQALPLLLISNPTSGDNTGHRFVQNFVLKILEKHNLSITRTVITDGPGRAGTEALNFLREHEDQNDIGLLVSGGDGTMHEIINALYSAVDQFMRPHRIILALIPSGTANALYSSSFPRISGEQTFQDFKLQSLMSLIRGRESIKRLSIMKTVIQNEDAGIESTTFSAVVTSTSLHASILHDSEALRARIPDMSRFRVAAEKNITRWYHGSVALRAPDNSDIKIYDHGARAFVAYPTLNKNPSHVMQGPFSYFLSTVNVDRLEPTFVIAPLYTVLPPETEVMDIIVVRPGRDPSFHGDSKEVRAEFAGKMLQMFNEAYNDGAHIGLSYNGEGIVADYAAGMPLFVEYMRCAGWEWTPVSIPLYTVARNCHDSFLQEQADEAAHLVCSDGSVLLIPPGGKATSSIVKEDKLLFTMCV